MTPDEIQLLDFYRQLGRTWQRVVLLAAEESVKLQQTNPTSTPRLRLLKGSREDQDDRSES